VAQTASATRVLGVRGVSGGSHNRWHHGSAFPRGVRAAAHRRRRPRHLKHLGGWGGYTRHFTGRIAADGQHSARGRGVPPPRSPGRGGSAAAGRRTPDVARPACGGTAGSAGMSSDTSSSGKNWMPGLRRMTSSSPSSTSVSRASIFRRGASISVLDTRFMGQFMARDYVTICEEQRDGQPVWTQTSVGRALLKSAPERVIRQDGDYRIMGAAWSAPIASVEVQVDDGRGCRPRLTRDSG
jgi:hypothetical protein